MPLAAALDSLSLGVIFAVCAVCAALGVWRWGVNWSASHRDLTRAARAETREQRLVRREFEALLDRMESCALELDRRADDACRRIQALISQADERVARFPSIDARSAPESAHAAAPFSSANRATDTVLRGAPAAQNASLTTHTPADADDRPLAVASAPVARVSLSSRIDRLRRKIRGVSLPGAPEVRPNGLQSTFASPSQEIAAGAEAARSNSFHSIPPSEDISAAPVTSPKPLRPAPFSEIGDPRFQRLYELADSGQSPLRIAHELSMPLGEVELILNLRSITR